MKDDGYFSSTDSLELRDDILSSDSEEEPDFEPENLQPLTFNRGGMPM